MPPKQKATEGDVLEIIYDFLTIDKTEHPKRYDRIKVAQILRKNGLVVTQGLNRIVDELCDKASYTKEYKEKWLDYLFNNIGVERKKDNRKTHYI
jgi:hypothetical protein